MDQTGEKTGQPARTEINELGEFGLIDRLTEDIQLKQASSVKGIGDDGAVIKYDNKAVVVSTDMLVEGIHFDLTYNPLKHLGYKAVVVNLSDIYAMNAIPEQITVSIAISSRFSVEALEEFYAGIKAACKAYQVDLVGGDTSSSQKGFIISVTAIGSAEVSDVVYRNTAAVGDLVCVSGDLGAAYMGLQLLEREKSVYLEHPEVQPDLEGQSYIVGRQLKPEARQDIIAIFRELGIKPTAMIDISDGLSSEINHICHQSSVGCTLLEQQVPIAKETYDMALKFNIDPITCALSGGEDYELLFTIHPSEREKVADHPDITLIGAIEAEDKGITLLTKGGNRHTITSLGWNALKS